METTRLDDGDRITVWFGWVIDVFDPTCPKHGEASDGQADDDHRDLPPER